MKSVYSAVRTGALKVNKYLPLLGGHTWKATWVVQRWAAWTEHCSEDVARVGFPGMATSSGSHLLILLLMMGILVSETF
jgi:hypothetical protein